MTVTVVDAGGLSGTATESVTVGPIPAPYEVPGTPGTQTIVSFSITNRPFSALYRNELAFYLVGDPNYDIGTLGPGCPDSPTYTEAALTHPSRQVAIPRGSAPGYSAPLVLPAGKHVAFYLVQDATTDIYLSGTFPAPYHGHDQGGRPSVFSLNPAGNDDGYQHVRATTEDADGNAIPPSYGWEDLTGGGDHDFDDLIFTINGTPAAGSGASVGGRVTEQGGGAHGVARDTGDDYQPLFYGVAGGDGLSDVSRG